MLALILPGVLVAATGVGAGDLMTASLAGAASGYAVLWLVVAGAAMKWFLNEGVARWQMATGETLVEGVVTRLGAWLVWPFLAYFALWAVLVSGALAAACGVAASAFWDLGLDSQNSVVVWGLLHAMAGLGIVALGGNRRFERVMGVCMALMFVAVLATAAWLRPDVSAILRANVPPTLPAGDLTRALAVLGGVGGTVTLLAYGYWIRDANRAGAAGLRDCRIDLGVCYLLTALFGLAMVVIGSTIRVEGKGARLALQLGERLREVLGPAGEWLFLAGFWAAVFTSLLGVWQSVPHLLADLLALRRSVRSPQSTPIPRPADLSKTRDYRLGLVILSLLPCLTIFQANVAAVQFAYSAVGSLFLPALGAILLVLNNRESWVGPEFRNGAGFNVALLVILAIYVALMTRGVALN